MNKDRNDEQRIYNPGIDRIPVVFTDGVDAWRCFIWQEKSMKCPQWKKGFADMLGVSRRTVEAWESGRTFPTPTARKLIYLISEDKSLAQKLMEA